MAEWNCEYDVIVVGAGHAGCEAALAAARLGARTLLFTLNLDHVAQMSCNPAIGGIAKGQLVREIDALGGEMALNADAAMIQFRMLNRSKGPAVHSPRAQCDRLVYQRRMKQVLERQPGLHVRQGHVVALRLDRERSQVAGVVTDLGESCAARAFVVSTGTFLNGRLHYGMQSLPGGRAGDAPSVGLSESLAAVLGLEMGRLKTGTPPRVLKSTVDFSALERQDPEAPFAFSFRTPPDDLSCLGGGALPQLPCYLTQSTVQTAELVRANLDRSPLYGGRIEGVGARYCPSFEDKVVRFPERGSHHVYLEPEGVFTEEYYLNGISTSLPPDVQVRMVQSLPGLERAVITRYAYAIEYDFVLPHQLDVSLAARKWPNLFLAGQINGTSGYEEAAGQGLVAGLNAARLSSGQPPVVLRRDQAYLGVMIDDLVTKDIVEPYRLFTSRAEYRLLLRQDNADLRLMRMGRELGLISAKDFATASVLQVAVDDARARLQTQRHGGVSLWALLRRPGAVYEQLPGADPVPRRVAEQLSIEARYEGYIQQELAHSRRLQDLDDWKVPETFDYTQIRGLRREACLKLGKKRPATLGQASRIDGVTPAEIALLQVHLRRLRAAGS